ncbi:MAG: hypothetical protein L3K00_06785 [Thermoplasmata archaeon]|nr:hypothetical protein [Thermoplasmata archaeon]
MRHYRVVVDLGLLRDGLRIGHEYGFRSLEELARTGVFLQSVVYEANSLRTVSGGVAFALHSPPLRMGAFSRLSLRWDDQEVPPDACTVRPEALAAPVRFSDVSPTNPVVFPVGERIAFTAGVGTPSHGPHTVRLELQSLAIPPVVWFRLTDHLHHGEEPPP